MILKYSEVKIIDNSSLIPLITREEHKLLLNGPAGVEHYKLLAYLSLQLHNSLIVELGTHNGTSSLAFSVNPINAIHTYDIADIYSVAIQPANITRHIGDIFKLREEKILLDSSLVFVDTAHMGDFEWKVFKYLKNNGYRGIAIYDDIHWSEEMLKFWKKVDVTKYDLTEIGHGGGKGPLGNVSGTGLVDFSGQVRIVKE